MIRATLRGGSEVRERWVDDALRAVDAARCAAQVLAWTAQDTTERMLAEAVLDALRGVRLVSRCVHSRE